MQPTQMQQAELNAANLAAHARCAAAQAAAGPATPKAATGNIPAASAGAESTDPFASMEQASDPGDNLTFISDDTELQQREHQREHSDLVRLQQELKQEKESAAKLAAEQDQEHKLRQAAEQGKAAEAAARIAAEQRLAAERAQFEQALAAARTERDARPTATQLQAITAELNARPTLDSLTKVTRDLAAKAAEYDLVRARVEAAELKAKQIVGALTPALQAIADKPEMLREFIKYEDLALGYVLSHQELSTQCFSRDPNARRWRAEIIAHRKKLGII